MGWIRKSLIGEQEMGAKWDDLVFFFSARQSIKIVESCNECDLKSVERPRKTESVLTTNPFKQLKQSLADRPGELCTFFANHLKTEIFDQGFCVKLFMSSYF